MVFQANTGSLWAAGFAGTGNQGLGMLTGTSPSLTLYPNPGTTNYGYEAAINANTGVLYVMGPAHTGFLGWP